MGTDLDWQIGDQQLQPCMVSGLCGNFARGSIDQPPCRTEHQVARLGCNHFSAGLAPLGQGDSFAWLKARALWLLAANLLKDRLSI